ncbi:histidine phosphatase family protein [bacterium]|nr:histidine phosphatase family protein [bacterium]
MKHLTILRHAKAAVAPANQLDMDRPLVEKGHKQIKLMASVIRGIEPAPDRLLSSPASRAVETAEGMAAAIKFEQSILLEKEIYEAAPTTLLEVLREQPAPVEHLVLIGHNPGLEMLISGLCSGEDSRLNLKLPTAGIAHIALEVVRWRQVRWGSGILQFLITPRSLKKVK